MHLTPFDTLTRRGFVIGAGLAAGAIALAPRRIFAADPPAGAVTGEGIVMSMRKAAATAKITTQALRNNISVLLGAGGNIAVLEGPDGKLLVDAGMSGARPQIIEALAAIGPTSVKYLVNTHWHFDHTDGNEWLHAGASGVGATIIAHENTRKHLANSTRVDAWDFTFPPTPASALPTELLSAPRTMTMKVNSATITITPQPPGHTDGDLFVDFTEADVLHLGDVWWNGHYPFIDYSTGGSIDGTIRSVKTALARATTKSIIIPGHGPVGDKPQLTEYHDMLTSVREKVAALKKQGKTLVEVVATKPTADYDAKFGHFLMTPELFTGLVYAGV